MWLYFRFPLSLRHVEDMLAVRGIAVSFQTVAEWAGKFGGEYARQIRRMSKGAFADKWHLDEMVVSIKGRKHWLWRAVDADGHVLDALVQSRRDRKAALRLLRKLLKQGIAPRVMITDKLRSYAAAKNELSQCGTSIPQGVEQQGGEFSSCRSKTERTMKRFKSSRQCQRFVSIHGPIANLFHYPRNLLPRPSIANFERLHGNMEPDHNVDGWMKSALKAAMRSLPS